MFAVPNCENIFDLGLAQLAQPTIEASIPFMNFLYTFAHNFIHLIIA